MKNLIILLSCLLFAGSVYGWGQKGHDVTAYIAECHLTPEAAQKIDKVLNGHSPVYYCNWMDIASHTPEYNYTKTWHYLNIDEGQTLETMPPEPQRRRADGRHGARRPSSRPAGWRPRRRPRNSKC